MHFSRKQNGLSQFYCAILNICIKFRTVPKKDDPPSLFLSEITDSE